VTFLKQNTRKENYSLLTQLEEDIIIIALCKRKVNRFLHEVEKNKED